MYPKKDIQAIGKDAIHPNIYLLPMCQLYITKVTSMHTYVLLKTLGGEVPKHCSAFQIWMWTGNTREAPQKLSVAFLFISNSKVMICKLQQKILETSAAQGTGISKTLG